MINELKNNFEKNYKQSIKNIESFLNIDAKNEEEKKFKDFINWLLSEENHYSTYEYLDKRFNFKENPFVCDELLSNIYHAMTDDGSMCFVKTIIEGKLFSVKMLFKELYNDEETRSLLLNLEESKRLIKSFQSGRERMNNMKKRMNPEVQVEDFVLDDIQFEVSYKYEDLINGLKEIEENKKQIEEKINNIRKNVLKK